MNIRKATQSYESWLGKQLRILPADLRKKHEAMAADPFFFFRATFYRWMQLWEEHCEPWSQVPKVLAVGDLHVENFGTWRDAEGRLVWGINDFDEVYPLPFTLDLIRLSTSAHLAIEGAHLSLGPRDACEAVLSGYSEAIGSGGGAFVLAERHDWLRHMVTGELRDPVLFWKKMDDLRTIRTEVPKSARRGLEKWLPGENLDYRVAHRQAGLGSLGRERYVALAEFHGGKVAREAKALAASACAWASGKKASLRIRYEEVLDTAVRCRDPFVHQEGKWIVRRLAPDCSRVELASMPKVRDEAKLLFAMGYETANVHLGTRGAGKRIQKALKELPEHWLHEATGKMKPAVLKDWKAWK
jgi:uncharacterized protein (DUF2252 family)